MWIGYLREGTLKLSIVFITRYEKYIQLGLNSNFENTDNDKSNDGQ